MAKVRFGGGVSEIRGSIAGNVFSRSRAGAIVRNRAVPVNQPTIYQSNQRAMFQVAVNAYRNLSEEEIDQWTDYAQSLTKTNSLGETYTPSPEQAFLSQTLNVLQLGGVALTVPSFGKPAPDIPAYNSLQILGTGAIGAGGTVDTVTYDITNPGVGIATLIEMTVPITPSIRNASRLYRQVAIKTGAVAAITTEYLTRFGWDNGGTQTGPEYQAGNLIAWRAKSIDSSSGLASDWLYGRQLIEPGA